MLFKRIGLSLLFVSVCLLSFSQGLKVKEFKQNLNDGSAFHAPMDAEEHPCGLIKVRTDNPDLEFVGDVVGKVENKMNPNRSLGPISSGDVKVFSCSPESKECLPLIYGSHKT